MPPQHSGLSSNEWPHTKESKGAPSLLLPREPTRPTWVGCLRPGDVAARMLERSHIVSEQCLPSPGSSAICGLHRGIIKYSHEKASLWAWANKNEAEIVNGINTKPAQLLALFNPIHKELFQV